VIYQGNENYYREATTLNGPPAGGGTLGGTRVETFGASLLMTNTWTHLAVTFNALR
jgi:hypothetical protein